jgi:hypothetical protein
MSGGHISLPAPLNHPRALPQLDQVLRVQARYRPIGPASKQQIDDRTTLNGSSSVIVA